MPIDAPFLVLGAPVFIGYFIVFDEDRDTLSLAPHSTSDKLEIIHGQLPSSVKQIFEPPGPLTVDTVSYLIAWLISLAIVTQSVLYFNAKLRTSWQKVMNPVFFAFLVTFGAFSLLLMTAAILHPILYYLLVAFF